MAGHAGWENNEVRAFGGTNGLQVQALSQRICELTICVQVIASSAVRHEVFWGLGQIKEHLLGMLSNLEVTFWTDGLCNELTPCVLQSMLKPSCVRYAHGHAER